MKKWTSGICIILLMLCVSLPIFGKETVAPPVIQLAANEEGAEGGSDGIAQGSGPALIVSKFSCGGDSVTAGKVFTLTYNLYNTSSKSRVENVVIKTSGGETFALSKSADTYFVEKIKAKGAIEHSDEYICSSETADGSYPITISATYDYYEDGVKASGNSEVKISVPVTQDRRVNIISASMGESDGEMANIPIYVGDETAVNYNFINNGFSKMLNTELLLVNADNGDTLAKAYLGTINPSTQMNGSSYLKYSFNQPGKKNLKFVIQYEDAHLNKATEEYAFSTTVEAAPPVDETMVEEETQSGFLSVGIIILVVIVLLTLGIVLLIRRKRKKKRLAEEALLDDDDDDDYEDYEDEDYSDENDDENEVVEDNLPADEEDKDVK